MKVIKILFILILPISCMGQIQISKNISRNICKEKTFFYKDSKVQKNEKLGFKYRKELIKRGELDFISFHQKLYILEGYDLETDVVYVTIWNEKTSFSYSYNKKSLQILEEGFISQKLQNLLTSWNLEKIKEYAKGNRAIIGGLDMDITCYILNKNTGKIEKVIRDSFQQFDDLNW